MDSTTGTVEIPDALKAVFDALEERFGGRLLGNAFFRGELTFTVAPEDFIEVATFCRDEPSLAFERLDSLVGNHFPGRRTAPFEVTAHLTSVSHTTRLRLKVTLAEGQKMPTATMVWPSANWEFVDHRGLRRLPAAEGFPASRHGGRQDPHRSERKDLR
jgi:NADH-quinone oxidoreductase subunit C